MVTISFHIKFLYCLRTLDIFVYNLMKTVEIFRLDMFGLDAYLVQPEENKKSQNVKEPILRWRRYWTMSKYYLNENVFILLHHHRIGRS